MADTIVWWAWATEYPDDGMIPIEAGNATEALAAAHDALAAYAQEGELMDVSVRRVTADDVHALQQRVEDQAAKIRELEARLMDLKMVAEVAEMALRRDELPDGDTDVKGWTRRKLAAALVAGGDTRPDLLTPTPAQLRCQCQWEAGDSPCRVHGEEVGGD